MIAKPFTAIRPDRRFASILHVPPYDVVDRDEVREVSKKNPYSFFHITRADADVPDGTGEYSKKVYETGRRNLERFLNEGVLVQDTKPCYYVFSQVWNDKVQTGIYAAVSCEEYEDNRIRKHELTRKEKEEDRTNHIQTVGADTGPVFLAFEDNRRDANEYESIVRPVMNETPEYDVTDEHGVQNTLWVVKDEAIVSQIEEYFQRQEAFYIADGHHRAASAVNVWRLSGRDGDLVENDPRGYFMAVVFPASQLNILPYNRVVLDLNGLTEEAFLEKVEKSFDVREAGDMMVPGKRGEIVMCLPKKSVVITPKAGTYNKDDVLQSLDVSILQNNLLAPILGIDDPRTSKRIQFVGGSKGARELIRRVVSGQAAVAFSLHPVSMGELMAVTDKNLVMPPKSTWFEPKLRDGLISYPIR